MPINGERSDPSPKKRVDRAARLADIGRPIQKSPIRARGGRQTSRRQIMIIATIACVVLIGMLCMLAFTLATYALPFLLGLEVARLAFQPAQVSSAPSSSVSLSECWSSDWHSCCWALCARPYFRSPWRSSTPRPPWSQDMRSSTASRPNTCLLTSGGNCSVSWVACLSGSRLCCG